MKKTLDRARGIYKRVLCLTLSKTKRFWGVINIVPICISMPTDYMKLFESYSWEQKKSYLATQIITS